MRILFVSSSSSESGGGELFFHKLAFFFIKLGIHVDIAYSDEVRFDGLAERAVDIGCTVFRIPYKRVYDRPLRSLELLFGAKSSGLSCIELGGYDVIHVSQQNIEDGIDLVAEVGSIAPDKLVVTIHIVEELGRLGQRLGWLRQIYSRTVYRKLENRVRFAFVCASALRLFRTVTGSDPVFGRIVYNGAEYKEPLHSPKHMRSFLGFEYSDYVIGSVGRLEEQKNYSVLVRAFEQLYKVHKNVRLLFVGDGAQRDLIDNLVTSLGLYGRVTITGWVDDPNSYLGVIDAFVLPSWYEGFPFALVEALIAGKTCIASNIPPHFECLNNCHDLIFDPENHIRLFELLCRIYIADPVLISSAQQSVLVAREKFSFVSMVQHMLDLYGFTKYQPNAVRGNDK